MAFVMKVVEEYCQCRAGTHESPRVQFVPPHLVMGQLDEEEQEKGEDEKQMRPAIL